MAATYLPGDALAIVTPRVALLTAADGFDGTDAVWCLATAGDADVPTILDALAGDGLAAMPGFALAVSFDDAMSLVLRDGYLALVDDSDGARTLDATGVATWVEHRIERGARVRLAIAGGATADDARPLPIESGVVRASAVTLRAAPTSTVTASAARRTDPSPRAFDPDKSAPPPKAARSAPPPAKTGPVAGHETVAAGADQIARSAEPTVDEEPDGRSLDEVVRRNAEAATEPAEAPPAAAAASALESATPAADSQVVDSAATLIEPEDSRFDAMFGATIAGRRPEDAAVRSDDDAAVAEPRTALPAPAADVPVPPTNAAAAVPRLGDHDDRTVTRSQLRRARVQASADAESQAVDAGRAIRLVLSTGREVLVDRPLLVGRAPQARNASGTTLPSLVTVDDEYVSSTHLEVRPGGESLVVTDVSSNGTVLKRPDVPPVPMRKGEPTEVADGAVLQISDDISISVIVS